MALNASVDANDVNDGCLSMGEETNEKILELQVGIEDF